MLTRILMFTLVANSLAQQKHQASSYASVNNLVIADYNPGKGAVDGEKHSHHRPKYEYKYGVEDKHTQDVKSQFEHRDGDVIEGEYALLQPDGRTRIVHYTADKHTGFSARVTYSTPDQH